MTRQLFLKKSLALSLALLSLFLWKTVSNIQPVFTLYEDALRDSENIRIHDRYGEVLSMSYQNHWNNHDGVSLYAIPDLIKQAFIISEDQNFFRHGAIDWQAKISAIWQNIKAFHVIRGASTITEQVIHMLCPRPRTLWSKWLEGIEAYILESKLNKHQIFEFYLNQIPYASHRRGVSQAARFYFNRDLSTLSIKEMLALVIMVKAPSSYDLRRDAKKIDNQIMILAQKLYQKGLLNADDLKTLEAPLQLNVPKLPTNAFHFVSYLKKHHPDKIYKHHHPLVIKTTIDASLQRDVQRILDGRLRALASRQVSHGAVLILNHQTGEVLTWVVGGAEALKEFAGQKIDAISVRRQPGSALKPFLYAAALEKGWSPITLIDDSPLYEGVGTGLHHFKNYSNTYYGPVTLREALANSLNIPAVRTIHHVGVTDYLNLLHDLGFKSLENSADIYDGGLALGNGEVTLMELVQGYATLANRGKSCSLRFTADDFTKTKDKQIFDEETTSLIGHILSDPWARRLEFGTSSVMNFPIQTAIKTGTSTDYRDAWIVGYDHKYVVGIWMGNLDNSPTDGLTGSIGPSLALRSIFTRLNFNEKSQGLHMSSKLIEREVCVQVKNGQACVPRIEYFSPNQKEEANDRTYSLKVLKPTHHLRMAIDSRIPRDLQKFEFVANNPNINGKFQWILNGQTVAETDEAKFLWTIEAGKHKLKVIYDPHEGPRQQTGEITFFVQR